MAWPAVVIWILIFFGLFSRGPALVYLFGVLGCFGTLQMLPGESIGGINVLPQFVCAAFLVGKAVVQRGNFIRMFAAACDPSRAGLFAGYAVYSLATALTLPQIFARQVEIIPIAGNILIGTSLLVPGSGNVTQPGYLCLTLLTIVAFAVLGTRPKFRRAWLLSILLGGIALVVTGLADLTAGSLGLSSLLDPFRTATYSLLTDNEVLGAKRVVGLHAEASAYGAACVISLSMLTLLRPCFDRVWRKAVVPPTIAGLAIMSLLSTSSSAYIGLVIFLLSFGLNWLIRAGSPKALARDDLAVELAVVGICLFVFATVAILIPATLTPSANMLDQVIFQKGSSDSYLVRSMWTRVAWESFLSSHYFGVGYGSARSSNWVVSIFANSGMLGALLLFVFTLRVAFAPTASSRPADIEFTRALRLSALPWLVMLWFAGTVPDIGVAAGSTIGLIVALSSRGRLDTVVPPTALDRGRSNVPTDGRVILSS